MALLRPLRIVYALLALAGTVDAYSAASQDTTVGPDFRSTLRISEESFDEFRSIRLWEMPWRYHAGDDSKWSRPEYDDASWELVSPQLWKGQMPKDGWRGLGWFRLHVTFDSTLQQIPLGLWGSQSGSLRIYWDGVHVSDTVLYRIPIGIQESDPGPHLLVIRYESSNMERVHESGHAGGFFIRLGDFVGTVSMLQRQRSEQMFFTGLILAFGLLHLLLSYFSSSREHFYYATFLVLMAAVTYVDIEQAFLTSDYETSEILLYLHRAIVPFTTIFFLRFLYSVFYRRCPRQFWVLTSLMLIVGVIIVLDPVDHYDYYVIMSSVMTLEMVRVLVVAVKQRKSGAWTFAIGLILVGLFSAYDSLLDLGLMAPLSNVTNAYYFGIVGMVAAMSVHLARDYARTNERLIEQMKRTQEEELARRLVEVDNARKTRELEDARQLQLSMLPPCQNNIPGIDICFHMTTATEVGGDYYDYRVEDDGSVIIVVGDATGHGMKAGTMVSLVKGLFITHPSFDDLPGFFKKCSDAIKQMNLGNLYMGLAIAVLKDNTLRVAIAGMPPVYLHRKATQSVEEILIKSMPLGGPASLPYESRETILAAGDSMLIMSDGLPELFNTEKDILDYPRVKAAFADTVQSSATDIVHALDQLSDDWRGSQPQTDDITLVVVKKR